jgi:hypothetical protein
MPSDLSVFAPNTLVKAGTGEQIRGWVRAIELRGIHHVNYHVCWFDGKDLRDGWFHETEVVADPDPRLARIGFIPVPSAVE